MFRMFFKDRSSQNPAHRCQDPLSHPQIARMDERQRADLPFDPRAYCTADGVDQARP